MHSSTIKGIALFYSTLGQKDTFIKVTSFKQWERGFGRSYHTSIWQKALSTTYAATRSSNLWELTQKLALRWYLTPPHIANFFPHSFSEYWRRCGGEGSLIHILWRCPSLSSFWSGISALILQVLKINVSLSPGLALCSVGIEFIPRDLRTILIHILLAARLTLVQHWKDHKPPNSR